jgi:hypothetical protein
MKCVVFSTSCLSPPSGQRVIVEITVPSKAEQAKTSMESATEDPPTAHPFEPRPRSYRFRSEYGQGDTLDGDSVQLWSDPEDRHNAVMKADRNAESGRWFSHSDCSSR